MLASALQSPIASVKFLLALTKLKIGTELALDFSRCQLNWLEHMLNSLVDVSLQDVVNSLVNVSIQIGVNSFVNVSIQVRGANDLLAIEMQTILAKVLPIRDH